MSNKIELNWNQCTITEKVALKERHSEKVIDKLFNQEMVVMAEEFGPITGIDMRKSNRVILIQPEYRRILGLKNKQDEETDTN